MLRRRERARAALGELVDAARSNRNANASPASVSVRGHDVA
jgi:hypothetical protein